MLPVPRRSQDFDCEMLLVMKEERVGPENKSFDLGRVLGPTGPGGVRGGQCYAWKRGEPTALVGANGYTESLLS